jgi:electron transfer flavoprotein alpha subunit
MESILCLAHTGTDGGLAKPALEAINAAKTLSGQLSGCSLSLGFIGEKVQAAADSVAGCGASRFVATTGAEFSQSRYATDAAAAEALAKSVQATLVIAPATSRMNRVLPGVAQRVGGRADTHVTGLSVNNGAVAISRWYYRQRMEATLHRVQRPWFVLLEPGIVGPFEGARGSARIEDLAIALSDECKRTTAVGVREPAPDAQTIRPEAELLFVAGAGWTKKQGDGQAHVGDAEKLILGFLKQARASLGSSKSLVDIGGEGQAVLSFLTHLNQVGQTGSTPRHAKGLATCCHGEEPHTVGWRFVNERRAINIDPNCGWARGKADVLYVADAFAVIRKVNELLAAANP